MLLSEQDDRGDCQLSYLTSKIVPSVVHAKQASKEHILSVDCTNMADEVVLVPGQQAAEIVVASSSIIPAPVADLLQRTPLENCQRLVVLGSARSGKSSLVAR